MCLSTHFLAKDISIPSKHRLKGDDMGKFGGYDCLEEEEYAADEEEWDDEEGG